MLVRYWMTESPVVISKNATLLQLLEYSHQYHARRFPVMDDGVLCGVVSISDLYRIISPRAAREKNHHRNIKQNLRAMKCLKLWFLILKHVPQMTT